MIKDGSGLGLGRAGAVHSLASGTLDAKSLDRNEAEGKLTQINA